MPLQDNRRVNGPPETYQITSFMTPQHGDADKSSTKIVNDKGLRNDTRRTDEVRPIYLKAGTVCSH